MPHFPIDLCEINTFLSCFQKKSVPLQKNKTMGLIGVVTGDIVDSTNVSVEDRDRLLSVLDSLMANLVPNGERNSAIFRGDSFQIKLSQPSQAARVALSIRSGLRYNTPEGLSTLWDARISVGVGDEAYVGENVGKSDGEAFRLSGRRLDDMKGTRLSFLTSSAFVNEELAVEGAFVDDIVSHWSRNQALVAHQYFQTEPPTQQSIARQMRVTTQRVNQLYLSAKVPIVLPFIIRFENLVSTLLP